MKASGRSRGRAQRTRRRAAKVTEKEAGHVATCPYEAGPEAHSQDWLCYEKLIVGGVLAMILRAGGSGSGEEGRA
jgi:hypothetical protein